MTENVNSASNQEPSSIPETPRSELEVLLDNKGVGAEMSADINWPTRHREILSGVTARQGLETPVQQKFSGRFVIEQSTQRYFRLVAHASASMNGMFTEKDMEVILNTTCHPVWDWDLHQPVAGMVADDAGIEELDDLEPSSGQRLLIEKLAGLSTLENAALVDVCERVWRTIGANTERLTFTEMIESCGLYLADTD